MTQHQKFELNPKQKEALALAADPKILNLMMYGGSRSGKTFLMLCLFIWRMIKVPSRHAMLRKYHSDILKAVWFGTLPKVMAIAFPDLPYHMNNRWFYMTLPNGSELWMGGLDNKKQAEKILGNEYSTLGFNEVSQLDYGSIQMARTRLAEKNELKKMTYYDQNPPKKNHFSFWVFEKGLNPVDSEPIKNPESYASILMNPHDNLQNIDESYIEILEGMPEAERNRFLFGEYSDESDGQVYYAFDRERHVKDLKQLPGSVFIGMDFNVDPMTAVVVQMVNGKVCVIDEVFLRNSDTYKMCDELKRRGYTGAKILPDATGRNRKTSGQSDFDILRKAGFVIESTHNPFVTDRTNNVNRLFANDEIFVDNKCKKLINDLERVCWKANKIDQKTEPLLSHISDALGYACYKLKPFIIMNTKPYTGRR